MGPTQWDMEGATPHNFLCGNTCDNCAGKGAVGCDATTNEGHFWSTMHVLFNDKEKMKLCPAEFGCVDNPLSRMVPPMRAICCPGFPPWDDKTGEESEDPTAEAEQGDLSEDKTEEDQEADLGDANPGFDRTLFVDWIAVGPPGTMEPLPFTDEQLIEKGWTKRNDSHGCDADLGYRWTETENDPDRDHPINLWTTKGGQITAMSVNVYGAIPETLQKYYVKQEGFSRLDVSFRKGSQICSGETLPQHVVGNTLIINPTGGDNSIEVALTEDWPSANGWAAGSCIPGMGRHYFLDTLSADGTNSYKTDGQFPVAIMYYDGVLDGMFFLAATPQNPGWDPNSDWKNATPPQHPTQWDMEGATPHNFLCGNTCDNCAGKGAVGWDATTNEGHFWSTMHVLFNDKEKMKLCPAEFGCVDNPLSRMVPPMRAICCPGFPPWDDKTGEESQDPTAEAEQGDLSEDKTEEAQEADLGDANPGFDRTLFVDWIAVGPPGTMEPLPFTDEHLIEKGWTKRNDSHGCDADLGYRWTETENDPDRDHPINLWTTKGGQITAMSVNVYGAIPETLQKYYVKQEGFSRLDVSFRKGSQICSGETLPQHVVGNTLIINPTGGDNSIEVALTEDWPSANGWAAGSCIPGMGRHYFLDT